MSTETVALEDGRTVIVLTVPKGLDKPYFDRNGVIWLKVGADKRRVNSKEELRRVFQSTHQIHADELPTKAGIDRLDKLRLRDFLRDVYKAPYPDEPQELLRLLQNMNLATDDGHLNLAGVLMFAERPEWIAPQFVVKAIRYPGNSIHVSDYLDTEDYEGALPDVFKGALSFVMRNLHKVQAGRGVNAPGTPEIAEEVFEELLVNALAHRDYLVSAPIRLFVFDDRIEIISPGHLPNNLTVEKIRAGNANIRNPILVSYIAKGLLPYHGLGSGIKRALEKWPHIDFKDDREGCLFTVTVWKQRPPLGNETLKAQGEPINGVDEPINEPLNHSDETINASNETLNTQNETINASDETISDLEQHVLALVRANPEIGYEGLIDRTGKGRATIARSIAKLKAAGLLRRVGSKKTGRWGVG